MKIRKIASTVILAFAGLVAPRAAEAAADGSIYEIHRVDENGDYLAPATEPLPAGSVARFVVRLQPTTVPTSYDSRFKPVYMGVLNMSALSGSTLAEIMSAFNPFQIGIYVSGQLTYATMEKFILRGDGTGDNYTDLIFRYEVKAGDFALPIRLSDANGEMITEDAENVSGYLIPSWSASAWKILSYKADGTTVDHEAVFRYCTASYHPNPKPSGQTARQTVYSLAELKFNVKSVDFLNRGDLEQWDGYDETTQTAAYWREVAQGSPASTKSKLGRTIALKPKGTPEKAVSLYVWSEDDAVVKVTPTPGMESVEVRDGVFRAVRQIQIEAGVGDAESYAFPLTGFQEGKVTNLVLSATNRYVKVAGTGDYLTDDHLTIPVKCGKPEASSITVSAGESPITADENFTEYKTVLTVKPTGVPFGDGPTTVRLNVTFKDGFTGDWKDYIHLSKTSGKDDWASTNDFTLVFAAGDNTEQLVYVYALGGDAHTSGIGKYLIITPTVEEDNARTYYTDRGGLKAANLNVDARMPAITSPADGTALTTPAKAEIAYPIPLKVADTYQNLQSTNGYEIAYKYKSTDTEWHSLSNYTVDSSGYLKKDNKNPAFTFPASKTGTCNMLIKIKAPSGYESDEGYTLVVTVQAPDTVSAQVSVADHAYPEFSLSAERERTVIPTQVSVTNVTISSAYDENLYVFFNSTDAEVKKRISGHNVAVSNAVSDLVIVSGQLTTGNAVGQFTVLDGDYTLPLDIELCTSKTYDSTKLVTSYKSQGLILYTKNVRPTVRQVSLGADDFYYDDNGKVMPTTVPLGATRKITITPAECDFDLADEKIEDSKTNKTFRTYVKIVGPDGDYIEYSGDTGSTPAFRGNPELQPISYEFNSIGTNVVTVKMKDKDMTTYGEEYKFYVVVTDQPYVSVEDGSLYENDVEEGKNPRVFVSLSEKAKVNLKLGIRLTSRDDADPGVLILDAEEATGTEPGNEGKTNYQYIVDFPKNRLGPEEIDVLEMDGTPGSKKGWNVTAFVLTDTTNSVAGMPWKDYFGAEAGRIQVLNVEPTFNCSLGVDQISKVAVTNVTPAHIGANDAVSWSVSDVVNDVTNGIHVQWYNVDDGGYKTEIVVTNASDTFSFIPTFKTSGTKQVTCYVWDKDMGLQKRAYTWTFEVAAAKTLKLYSNGPSGRSSSTASSHYITALGRGEGHAWARSTLTAMRSWISEWLCGDKAKTVDAYAWGYKTRSPTDDGSLNGGYDIAIDKSGTNESEGGKTVPTVCYTYEGTVDSFLYAWIVEQIGTDGVSESKVTVSPEQYDPTSTVSNRGEVATVTLPNELGDDEVYPEAIAEAVFAREKYASDNLGDINQDGIPDLFFKLYKFDLIDDAGALSGDDQTDLSAFNEDEDYLPTMETSAYGSLIPGLADTWATVGTEFTAFQELRGADTDARALNDAAVQLGYPNVRSDRIYEDPTTSPTSTLSYVEWLAWSEYKAVHPTAKESDWSPERPTDPTKADTDGDKMPDGYEYYFWYRAHVGYLENGVHKYLTGRRYDPRNPGEGTLISSDQIALLMDPRSDLEPVDFPPKELTAGSIETRDTDNDGLSDLIEFEIGTNPFDFDTDGDGLPDGFEILLCGTDPLTAMTVDGISDAMRNYDGDAMAFTTPALEANVVPTPLKIDVPYSFALVDAKGYTDGVQWYVSDAEPTGLTTNEAVAGTSLVVDGVTYVTTNAVALVGGRLAADLPKATTWTVTNIVDGVFTAAVDEVVALMPTRLPAGTVVASTNAVTAYSVILTNAVADANAAWVYGRSVTSVTTGDSLANMGGFGMLAVGHYKKADANVRLAALPKADTSVATLHYLVYQKYGFDPRTAWNANTPLATRWGKTVSTGEGESASTETVANNFDANWGYAGVATRTREFTLYDEFLVFSFFLNNNTLAEADVTPTTAQPWSKIWSKYTTNGQGPNEPAWTDQYADSEGTIAKLKGRTAETDSGTNGADTDEDGVPDGWELYVMAGPKDAKTGKFHFAAPYNDGFYSSFGPFVKDAAKASVTDNSATGGNDSAAGDGDGLTELQEFAGTDSCAYYSTPQGENESAYSTTIVRPDEHKTWFNKFFPTDPWNKDTDGDGLSDSQEKGFFAYGDVDTGKVAVPGGGLNPCTVDTDLDGLPDGWEKQFAGSTVYTGEDCQWAEGTDADGNAATSSKTSLQGLCDGMDGTVFDAFNSPRVNRSTTSGTGTEQEDVTVTLDGIGLGVAQVVDRDYDHDGLENWQEYLTGVMRCWRYDDPLGTWGAVPDEAFFDADGNFILEKAMEQLGFDDENEFWYETLFNKGGKFYNPHFVSGTSPAAQYFSRVTNGWDMCFSDTGSYYVFYDRVNEAMYSDIWGYKAAPKKYISTSPIVADTDKDGMDDGYELFHGMNPLLGESGVLVESDGPCDVVFDAWYTKGVGAPVDALHNNWMDGRPGYGDYDFVAHPWLNGLVDADPDGDDIRSQDEAIMPMVAPSTTWYHTDPTPLWMTDSSYSNSLTRLFFRLPTSLGPVSLPSKEYIEWNGVKYYFRDCDGYVMTMAGPVLAPFLPDRWSLAGEGTMNWMYSFEENEGYDTDHDAASDSEELSGKFRAATDPQDANSPRRRQAMYFQGPENPSALQSMPFASELYPRAATGYPDDLSLLQYTVECWVRPESTADATVIERAVYTSPSHCADEMLVRCNFRIAVKDGKWYTKFDSNGTLADKPVEVVGATSAAVGEWTYVAATYDAKKLVLYVNGEIDGQTTSSLKPAYGSSAVVVYPGESKTSVTNSSGGLAPLEGEAHTYWYDREYEVHAFLVGASFRTDTEPGVKKNHLNVLNAKGWDYYKDFFKGYVDEIRVWDGALSSDTIASTHYALRKRFSREDALANRSTVYSEWSKGQTRYNKDGDGSDFTVTPELRFHWGFDSVPGAENAAKVAVAPRGFINGAKAEYSRPDGYVIPWWNAVVDGYGSVYAGLRNWVTWIPNTVTHLPRFDATTLDSAYWSENYAGDTAGTYKFARTAEPVSLWTQFVRHGTDDNAEFQTTCRRFWLSNNTGTNASSTLSRQFEFTGRHLNQSGDDLLPLGGAFVKYVDRMWDDNKTASETWDYSGTDADGDGLPDWWQTYAEQNYREGLQPGTKITWDTVITYAHNGVKRQMKAGQAYLYDIARGAYVDLNGVVHAGPTAYAQQHMTDGLIPDWWKKLMKIDDAEPLADTDNDGLSNFAEYLASEAMSFGVTLDPTLAKSDTKTLDYFRAFGKLYLGEMLTDHDQMEDHWERSLSDENVASASLWDATKDADGDGWDNFAENRYNGHKQSTLAQLVSHAMGDAEVLDAPIPSIKLTVRYNGANLSTSAEGDQPTDGGESSAALPNLVVRTFSADSPAVKADAKFTMQPGTTVSKEVYMGGWEDRVVRGTMAPGNVDITSVNLRFRQIVQSDLYSWTDESGTHISRPYSEFKAALEKDSTIVRNVQLSDPDDEKDGDEAWLKFEAATNPRGVAESVAVTIGRDALTQKGMIAVYGEEVGSIDLTTGDFEFDMAKLINLTGLIGTYDEDPADAWGLKEAIFKLTYRATIPALQANKMQISLATADTGFVRGGKNTIAAFFDNDGNGEYTPGEPFGVLTDVDIGWAGRELEMELTDMSAVTPRIDLWSGDSDRAALTAASNSYPSYAVVAGAPAAQCRVRVMRYALNGKAVRDTGVATNYTVFDQTFDKKARTVFSEGDLLKGGALDIDWDNLLKDSTANAATYRMIWGVTNATYVVVFDEDTPPKPTGNTMSDNTMSVQALGTTVERRFEFVRRRPTPCPTSSVFNRAHPTFAWRIDGEDPWVATFGTSYTAFKIRVKTSSGAVLWESKITRLPPKDGNGIYRWTAPISVGSVMPNGALFENFANYTWEMALYNAKFRTDDVMSVDYYGIHDKDSSNKGAFSDPLSFRMNVTTADASSEKLAVRVCYSGPAKNLAGKVRVQAFKTPDFTGDPLAEVTIGGEDLSPAGVTTNAALIGLSSGAYYLRAYIDTDGDLEHDDWESWGYLSERDRADKAGIFNPVSLATAASPAATGVRKVFIEDCDTDGDWFPDVWEAEQNGNVFDSTKIAPVKGTAELIGVNTNLDATLNKTLANSSVTAPLLMSLRSPAGVAMMSGVSPSQVSQNAAGVIEVESEIDEETLAIVGFDLDVAARKVALKIGAEVNGALDTPVADFLAVTVRKGSDVKVVVKHAETIGGDWTTVATGFVKVTDGAGDIDVTFDEELPSSGFFKVEIVQ